MNNKEFELVLMNIILALVAILILLFIIRGIKVLTTKKIKTKDDAFFVLFVFVFVALVGYCLYKIKSAFKKKSPKDVMHGRDNGFPPAKRIMGQPPIIEISNNKHIVV